MPEWTDYVQVLLTITLLVGGGGVLYQEYWDTPRLKYEVLPPYQLSEQRSVTGIILRNEGRETAHSVRMEVESNQVFTEIYADTHEKYSVIRGGENSSHAVLEFPRLTPSDEVSFYMRVNEDNPNTQVTVTHSTGKGSPAGEDNQFEDTIIVVLSSIFLLFYVAVMVRREFTDILHS